MLLFDDSKIKALSITKTNPTILDFAEKWQFTKLFHKCLNFKYSHKLFPEVN